MNNSFQVSCCLTLTAAVTLLAGGGCGYHRACGGGHHQVVECYAAWPCYGYHSTCWRPWPGECVNCPSPFAPGDVPIEEVPSELTPVPMPIDPATPAAPTAPVPEAADPAAPTPAPDGSSSSRRRTFESQVINLESLRWAPTDNR